MRSVIAVVYLRELRGFLRRPHGGLILWLAGLPPLAAAAWLTALSLRGGVAPRAAEQPVSQFLGSNVFLAGTLLTLVPLLTMNLLAGERRRGVWDLYASSPAGFGGVVAGKFLAAWTLLLACLAPWPLVLTLLRCWTGTFQPLTSPAWLAGLPCPAGPGLDFDPGYLWGGCLGLLVVGATLTALGTCCSALARQPVLAALTTGVLIGLLLLLSLVPGVLENWRIATPASTWVRAGAVWIHLAEFSQGVVSLPRCAQHALATLGLLWLSQLACRSLPGGTT